LNYQELKNLILYHNHQYYDLSDSKISDGGYDVLYDELVEKEKKQGWVDGDSPTLVVGSIAGKIKHPHKLYSLQKVYDRTEVDRNFKIKTPKIDGTNLTVTYRKGKLIYALTRGDGEFGDSVTHLTPYIKGIPNSINYSGNITFTGECVTDNIEVANFRNYVSGSLGLKEADDIKDRQISYIVHDALNLNLGYEARLTLAKTCGFRHVLETEFCNQYPQDGIVYRVASKAEEVSLGYTSKHPKFAIALKKREVNTKKSILQQVTWSVGRTGTVNPVGIIEPVILEDATISRVTLHNFEFIESQNMGLGDLIEIERAGGVIPKVLRVVQHSKLNQKITREDVEREINGKTIRRGPRLYVEQPEEHGTTKLLQHFIRTLKIKGLGPASIKKLGITHPCDLFLSETSSWPNILGANGFKILEEIERAKTKPYYIVLAALGIEGVGTTASRNIVKVIPTFKRLKEIDTYSIEGIGPVITNNIITWLITNESWVLEMPLQLETEEDSDFIPLKTKGKICITGKLDITKRELEEILINYGYTASNSLTKDCIALISDGGNSTKTKKAGQYSIKIINYWENKESILNGQIQ
jgi:DNA ligase (NAD+)